MTGLQEKVAAAFEARAESFRTHIKARERDAKVWEVEARTSKDRAERERVGRWVSDARKFISSLQEQVSEARMSIPTFHEWASEEGKDVSEAHERASQARMTAYRIKEGVLSEKEAKMAKAGAILKNALKAASDACEWAAEAEKAQVQAQAEISAALNLDVLADEAFERLLKVKEARNDTLKAVSEAQGDVEKANERVSEAQERASKARQWWQVWKAAAEAYEAEAAAWEAVVEAWGGEQAGF